MKVVGDESLSVNFDYGCTAVVGWRLATGRYSTG
jgi:hypothetical protein